MPAEPLKVLVVSQYFWPEEFRINEVVASLREAGCEVSVLTGQPNYPGGKVFEGHASWRAGQEQHPDGYSIFRVPLLPRDSGSGVRLALNYLSFVVAASIVGPYLLRGKPMDVIFVYGISPILQGIPAVLLRRLKRAANVIWIQDLWPESLVATGFVRNPRILRAVGWLTGWIYQHADRLLIQSKAFKSNVRQLAGPDIPIHFHPNPGDIVPVDGVASYQTSPLSMEAGFNVVFAGNLGTAQSLETLVEAAAVLQDQGDADIRLVLVGTGSKMAWLKSEIGRRELDNMLLAGRYPSAAMPPIFERASALLVSLGAAPNLAQTIPSKIPSYLAAARPIVACMNGEGARIVKEAGAGLTVPAEDAKSLAAALAALRDMSPSERAAMGNLGRAYYEKHFSPHLLARSLIEHFEAAVEHRRTTVRTEEKSGI